MDEWRLVASGSSDDAPDTIAIEGEQLLIVRLPFDVPDWAVGPIETVFGALGGSLEIVGAEIRVRFGG